MTGRTQAAEGGSMTGRRGGLSRLGDEDLVPLVAGGDARAFAALYDRHCRAAYSLARRVMREGQAAEDLTQEAFLKVWRSASGYRPERGSVRNWILSVVHNRGIDELRSAASRRRTQARLERSAPRSQPSEAFAEAWRNRQRERVGEALNELPSEQVEVLELAYFSGHTHAEISDLLGLPLGTVKGRMRLAREKLRDRLEPDGAAGSPPTADRGRVLPEAAAPPSTRQGNAIPGLPGPGVGARPANPAAALSGPRPPGGGAPPG